MPIPFGVSVGDFIAGIELMHDIISCLEDSAGSRARYGGVIAALKSLESSLHHAKIANVQSVDKLCISEIVTRSEETIKRFAGKIQKYDRTLGSTQDVKS